MRHLRNLKKKMRNELRKTERLKERMKIIENQVAVLQGIPRTLALIIFLIEEELETVIILIRKILTGILMEVRVRMNKLKLI